MRDGGHAKAILDSLGIGDDPNRAAIAAHGVDEHHVITDQLGEIFVSSGNDGSHALGRGLRGQGANDIIGL